MVEKDHSNLEIVMAWIVGIIDDKELAQLREIGWEDEDPSDIGSRTKMRAFWVDSSVFQVMTGPDWEPLKTDSQPKGD